MTEPQLIAWGSAADAVAPGRYRHYKGGEYIVVGLAHLADGEREGEEAVVYLPTYPVPGQPVAVRSVASWQSLTDDGQVRFERM